MENVLENEMAMSRNPILPNGKQVRKQNRTGNAILQKADFLGRVVCLWISSYFWRILMFREFVVWFAFRNVFWLDSSFICCFSFFIWLDW